MHQALDARAAAGLDQLAREVHVHPREAAAATSAFVQDADEVHHRGLAVSEQGERARVVDVGGDELERGNRREVLGAHRVAGRDGDPPAVPSEGGAQVRAHEA